MDESLSLKFQNLEKMMTVGDYEGELKKLAEENFQLKHQMAYLKANQNSDTIDNNIQNLLYDSKQSIDILENENKNLTKQVENLREIMRSSSSDRENLISKLKDYENRLAICEEENDRLLNHLESVRKKSDSLIEDYKGYDLRIKEYENTINEMKVYIQNLEKDKDVYFTEGKKLLDDRNNLQNNINNYSNERSHLIKNNEDLKKQVTDLASQLEELKKSYNNTNEKLINTTKEKKKIEEEIELEKKRWNLKEQKLKDIISDYEIALNQKKIEFDEIRSNLLHKEDVKTSKEFQDLKCRYEDEANDLKLLKRENESLLSEMKTIRESYSNLKRKLEVTEDDKRALKYKIAEYEELKNTDHHGDKLKEEYAKLKEHYVKLKKAHEDHKKSHEDHKKAHDDYKKSTNMCLSDLYTSLNTQLDKIQDELQDYIVRINSLNCNSYTIMNLKDNLVDDNKRFLINLNIPIKDVNGVVNGFSKVYEKMKNKIDVLNNEIKDITKFNDVPNDNRMKEVVENFITEFKNAKEDLISTKEYLEKKSKEIKEIKKEKGIVEKKLIALKIQHDELKLKDKKIKESYNGILNTLKRKDEIINKLEMRMIH